jgi:hypothetical protein
VSPDQTTAPGNSSSTSSTIREELSGDASRLGDTAKERAKEEAETRKQQVTQTARSTSSALGRAADELDQDDSAPGWLAAAFRQTAQGIERVAGSVEGRSADQLARDLTRFARDNPTTFLAASAAAGFAAARLLRAGAEYRSENSSQGGTDDSTRFDNGSSTFGGTGTSSSFGQGSDAGYAGGTAGGGLQTGTGTDQAGTGYGSTTDYGTSTSSTEPAGYGSNPIQGGPA